MWPVPRSRAHALSRVARLTAMVSLSCALAIGPSCGAPRTMGAADVETPSSAAPRSAASSLGAERPATHAADVAADPSPVEPAPEPAAALETAPNVANSGETMGLGCGRWVAALPVGARVMGPNPTAPGRTCQNPEYPFEVDARGVAGVDIELTLDAAECAITIRGSDIVPGSPWADAPASLEVELAETADGATLDAAFADGRAGIALAFESTTPTAGCVGYARGVARLVSATLAALPLGGGAVHLTLSSAGHGMDVTLPPDLFAVSLGGGADEFETAYELRSRSGEPRLLLFSWWEEGTGGFRRRVMRGLPRPVSEDGGPYPNIDICAPTAYVETGPGTGVVTRIFFCGNAVENREMEAVLRAATFTPAWPASTPGE